jgi:DNA replication protein DnaC
VWDGQARSWRATYDDPCPACASLASAEMAMDEALVVALHRYQLDTGRYAQMTLDRYWPDPAYPSQARAKRAVEALVETWAGGDWSAGILLCSPHIGIGKTHLAIAAAREGVIIRRHRLDERLLAIWDMPSFVDAVRQTYDDGGTAKLIAGAQDPAILVLDDIGSEHVTPKARAWYQALMFRLINARWTASRATIATTNLDDEALWQWVGRRVYSRLLDLTGPPLQMHGQDHRLRAFSTPEATP